MSKIIRMSGTTVKGLFNDYRPDWLKVAGDAEEDPYAAADRTVYMDSNIALTNGAGPIGSNADVKTIPNLYEAIHGMAKRIDDINTSHGPSTADAGLYVTCGDENISADVTQKVITMYPAEFGTTLGNADLDDAKTAGGTDTHVFRISAPNIEFEVTNQNNPVDGYFVQFASTAQVAAVEAITAVNNIDLVNITDDTEPVKTVVTDIFVLVPLEGSAITSSTPSGAVPAGTHCKLFKRVKSGQNMIWIVAVSHMIVTAEMAIKFVATKSGDDGKLVVDEDGDSAVASIQVPSFIRYRLGAIIEAIQELNRRTMFMDTDMSFQGAMSYNDYNTAESVKAAQHIKNLDGLPAASDGNLAQHYELPTA